ncbi:MAG: hypothetical protein WKF57_04060 [Nakamurella sp.]
MQPTDLSPIFHSDHSLTLAEGGQNSSGVRGSVLAQHRQIASPRPVGPPRLALAREARTVLTGYLGRRFTLRGDSDEEDVELRTLTRPVNKPRPDLIHTGTTGIFDAYTGVALQPSWVMSTLETDQVHRTVTPADDDHWATRRLADGSLDPIINASNLQDADVLLDHIGDHALRDLAWWIAGRLAKYREIDSHPLIADALRTRSMSEEARHLAAKARNQ